MSNKETPVLSPNLSEIANKLQEELPTKTKNLKWKVRNTSRVKKKNKKNPWKI